MKCFKFFLVAFLAVIFGQAKATTWDEPWQNEVIKQAGYFVLAKVLNYDADKGVTIRILNQFGGSKLEGELKITNFYLLHLCSSSGGEGPEFEFDGVDSCYFFIKKNAKNEYCISTPTSGFATVQNGQVNATYRHSYHQALVDQSLYEKTMTAIFNHYHNLPYDTKFINDFVKKYVSMKPAGFSKDEISTFFNQHVALECIYHLSLPGYYEDIIPFLHDKNFHNQVSAARALIAYNDDKSRQSLMGMIRDTSVRGFVKVMCIWTLGSFKPRNLKPELEELQKTASEAENGFGGNIMDPRVCTNIPTVKEALTKLVAEL